MKFYKYNLDYLAMTIEEKYWSPNFVAGYVPTDLFPVTGPHLSRDSVHSADGTLFTYIQTSEVVQQPIITRNVINIYFMYS